MSNHTPFIVQLVKSTSCISYLELGLYVGETFEQVYPHVINCVGVDIKDLRDKQVGTFYQMTTDEFFSRNSMTFDIIFIDADHRYESVRRDLDNTIKILNRNGTIVLHDTDPTDRVYLQDGYCSDCYRINDYLKSRTDTMFITLPIGTEGLTLVRKFNNRRVVNFI